MTFLDVLTRAIKGIGGISISHGLETGYNNLKNHAKLTQAILRAYERPEYKPSIIDNQIVKTHCSEAARDIAGYMGCHEFADKNADSQYDLMKSSTEWREVPMSDCQFLANAGTLVFAALPSALLGGEHGHICVIRPGEEVWSSHWNAKVPSVMNVGGQNFILWFRTSQGTQIEAGLNGAFRSMPKFFAWVPTL
jgi:hypothetical protein